MPTSRPIMIRNAPTAPRRLAANRRQIPYLGPPEDELTHAFVNAYSAARAHLRTVDLRGLDVDTARRVVQSRLDAAAHALAFSVGPILVRIMAGAMEDAEHDILVLKAEPAKWQRHYVRPGIPQPRYGSHANVHVINAARTQAADMVTYVNKTQRKHVNRLIVNAVRLHHNPLASKDLIHNIADVTGLFPRWQIAVNNLYRNMIAQGVPNHVAVARRQRYSDELLVKRGQMIARTEIMRAMNLGRLAQWQQQVDDGVLDGDTLVKVWVCSPIDPCPECEELGGLEESKPATARGVEGLFKTEHGDIPCPPLHPHCRCTMNVLVEPGETGSHPRQGPGRIQTWSLDDYPDAKLAQLLDSGHIGIA